MKLLIKGMLYEQIKNGDLGDWGHGQEENCGDCGIGHNKPHIQGCDIERCPCCGLQLITCDCGVIYMVKDGTTEKELRELKESQVNENKRLALESEM